MSEVSEVGEASEVFRDGADAIVRRQQWAGDALTADYGVLITELQGFLDAFASADLTREQIARVQQELARLRGAAETAWVPEERRRFGRGRHRHVGVHAMAPEIVTEVLTDDEFMGRATIGDFFIGANAAAHGGVVTLLFDEMFGRVSAGVTRSGSRTAYLNTDFRAITPVNEPLVLRGRVERIEGRKRFLTGEILHGDTLCAEAHALFIELRPGQQ